MRESDSFSLFATVKTVRDLLQRKINDGAAPARAELEAGLREIEALWEELRSQSRELASERQRYSEFFDYAPDAYLITDSRGMVREANRAAAELLRVPARELAGKPLANYIPEESRRDFRVTLARISAQPDSEVSAWRGSLLAAQDHRIAAVFRVRALPVHDGGAAALCWLMRRAD